MNEARILKRIQESYEKYGWTEEQQRVFNKFVTERCANYSNPYKTLEAYLDTLNKVVRVIKKPFADITYDDLVLILNSWQKEYSSATVYGWKSKLKAFFRWESGNKYDLRVLKIRAGGYVSPVTLDDILTDDEIGKLREVAKDNPRNLAMLDFHLLWGPRPSESARIKISHVKVTDTYIVINIPQTKTIARPVPIPLVKASTIQDPDFLDAALNTCMSLRKYLNIHPGYPGYPDYPLWYNAFDKSQLLTKQSISDIFRRLGRDAGLKKTLNTYVLRRTAFNRFKGADREKLCVGFGWKPGSRMPTKVYNKLRPQDVLGTLLKDENEPQRKIHTCPECHRENPKDLTFCGWCGAPLVELPASATLEQFHADQRAHEELEELREKLGKIEKILSGMEQLPGFEKFMEETAKKHSG